MFKKFLLLATLLCFQFILVAQVPQKMNFQAVMRNANNAIIAKCVVGMRISILQGSPTGPSVYTETQTVNSDYNGLVSLQIGGGIAQLGTFASIDWAHGPFFLKTEADPNGGVSYSIIGTSELLSVPYALYAVSSGSSDGLPGPIGPTGSTGLPGAAGATGSAGVDGLPGVAGANGLDGLPGVAGANGLDGAAGLDGTAGLAGATGLNGMNGLPGAAGLEGAAGLPGSTGLPGAVGINGTNGTNGIDGLDAPGGEPFVLAGTTSQYYRGDKTWQTLNTSTVGLGNVDNTSDVNKIVSTPTQTALNLKSNLISPTFTGTPLAPTAALGTNTTQIATTEFVLTNSNQYFTLSEGAEIIANSTNGLSGSGLVLSPDAGNYFMHFNAQFSVDPVNTVQAGTDLDAVYTSLMAKNVTNSSHSVTYGSEILSPGVYTNTGATTANGTLTLDGGGDPNSEFVFRSAGAFGTGAGFNLVLTNSASACNVYWIAEGAIALGAGTSIKGTLIANNGAVTVGSLSTINGNLFSTAGAIGLDATTISVLSGCSNIVGNLAHFALYTKTGGLTNAGSSVITGDIATQAGTITGFSSATINGATYTSGITPTSALFSLTKNGALIPFSERTISASTSITSVIDLQSVALIGAGDTIGVRWTINAGTLKINNRNMTALRVR
jgi:hypothetical protein